MESLIDLYQYAEDHGHAVYWYGFDRPGLACLSVQQSDGTCDIAIDPCKICDLTDEYCKLAHELGHCETGAFYNRYAACDIRQKHENKADKWAVEHTIQVEELDSAIADGYSEIWSLAEYFGVTEDFMRKAICWYTYGNLAAELYF